MKTLLRFRGFIFISAETNRFEPESIIRSDQRPDRQQI